MEISFYADHIDYLHDTFINDENGNAATALNG
jgi:hypothetical protein